MSGVPICVMPDCKAFQLGPLNSGQGVTMTYYALNAMEGRATVCATVSFTWS
jgi:hypothetical protein